MSATLGPLINRSKPDTTIIIYFRQQDGVYRPAPELGDRLTAKELQGNPYLDSRPVMRKRHASNRRTSSAWYLWVDEPFDPEAYRRAADE